MKTKKFFISILLIILIFFINVNPVKASIFSDDDKEETNIEETIDKDEGRSI